MEVRDLEPEAQALRVKVGRVGIEPAADSDRPVVVDAEIGAGGARRKRSQQPGVANRDDRKERRVKELDSGCAR